MSSVPPPTSARSTPPRPARHIFLADCDAMFVSVCRLEDPEGAGKTDLLIVGGTPDGRGVVASASYGCRAYGVRSAMPTSRALQLCPDAMVVSVPRGAVSRVSRQIRAILAETAVVLEAASVDEFYLDLSGTERVLGDDLGAIAHAIRERVLAETGISLSVGCGTNKLVAKLAATLAKPGGVHAVAPGDEARFMTRFALSDIPGIGPKAAERFERFGLRTVEDARGYPLDALVGIVGRREGESLFRRLRGLDDRPVEARGRSKSHSREDTFAEDLTDDAAIERELLALVVRCATDLRRDGRLARTITVKVKDRDFRIRQAGQTLERPPESDRRIFEEALRLLRRLRRERRTGVRLLGITLSGLRDPEEAGEGVQLTLFDDGEGTPIEEGTAPAQESEAERELARAVHALRTRYGDRAVLPGTLLGKPREKPREAGDPGGHDLDTPTSTP
jgi:DNA polymerase IV